MSRKWSEPRRNYYECPASIRLTKETLGKVDLVATKAGISRSIVIRDLFCEGWESRFGEVIDG